MFVFEHSGERFGRVNRSIFQVGERTLIEITQMVRDAETVGTPHSYSSIVSRLPSKHLTKFAMNFFPVSDHIKPGVEKCLTSCSGSEGTETGNIGISAGKQEEINTDTRFGKLVGRGEIPFRRGKECPFFVGVVIVGILPRLKSTKAMCSQRSEEEIDLATDTVLPKNIQRSL